MRTFFIASALFALFIFWLINKPIPHAPQVARAFTDSEIDYLEKSFDYAMDNLKEGDHMDWSTAGVNGRISVGNIYTSKQKAECRKYIEIARTYNAQKVEQGTGCKRSGREGWCRVYGSNPQSCALETQESMLIKRARFAIMEGSQMIDEAMGEAMNVDPKSMLPDVPRVHMPNMPDVGLPSMPRIDKPDLSDTVHEILPWNNK